MSDDQFNELKELLDFKLGPIHTRIDGVEKRLGSRMDSGFARVGDVLEALNDRFDTYISKTNKRIKILENVR